VYDKNVRRADDNPHGIFHSLIDPSTPPAAGLVGLLGSSTFSLPAVERVLAEMEGGGIRRVGSAPSPTGQTQHEVLQNFFKSLLNTEDRGVSPGSASAVNTCEPWCDCREGWYFDRAEDIRQRRW
jgi:dynein light intermediate chain 1